MDITQEKIKEIRQLRLEEYVLQGKVKTELKALIQSLSQERLEDLTYQLDSNEDTTIKERQSKLYNALTDENYLIQVLGNMKPDEYEALPKSLEEGYITDEDIIWSHLFFIRQGLAYLYFEDNTLIMFFPKEIKDRIKSVLDMDESGANFEMYYQTFQAAVGFCTAAANLYGAIDMKTLEELFNTYGDGEVDAAELNRIIMGSEHGEYNFIIEDGWLMEESLYDYDEDQELEMLKSRSIDRYHADDYKDFIAYSDDLFIPDNQAYSAMNDMLRELTDGTDERVEDVLGELYLMIHRGDESLILWDMKRMKVDLSDRMEDFAAVLLECLNHTRLWQFYGHTRSEAGQVLEELPEMGDYNLWTDNDELYDEDYDPDASHLYMDIMPNLLIEDGLMRLTEHKMMMTMERFELFWTDDDWSELNIYKLQTNYEELLQWMNDVHLNFLQELLKVDYMTYEAAVEYVGEPEALANLPENLLLFPGIYQEEPVIIMPEQLKEILRYYQWNSLTKESRQNTLIRDLTIGLCQLYGVISAKCLFEMLNGYLKTAYSDEYLEKRLTLAFATNEAVHIYEELYVFILVEDTLEIIEKQAEMGNLPYMNFSKQEVLRASKGDYYYRSSKAEQMSKLLRREMGMDKKTADNLVAFFAAGALSGLTVNQMIADMGENLGRVPAEFIELIMPYVVGVYNATPQWGLKGHSPNDIHNSKEIKPNKPTGPVNVLNHQEPGSAKADVIDFGTRKKVGRNDPCPCGSGRKYKHCCGK